MLLRRPPFLFFQSSYTFLWSTPGVTAEGGSSSSLLSGATLGGSSCRSVTGSLPVRLVQSAMAASLTGGQLARVIYVTICGCNQIQVSSPGHNQLHVR